MTTLYSLLMGIGLSTYGQFVELDMPTTTNQLGFNGQVGLFYTVNTNHGEKFDNMGIQARMDFFKPTKLTKIMLGLNLGVEHHLHSSYYNETYLTSTPSINLVGHPFGTKKGFNVLTSVEPCKAFYALKGDTSTSKGVEGRYSVSLGILFTLE